MPDVKHADDRASSANVTPTRTRYWIIVFAVTLAILIYYLCSITPVQNAVLVT